MEANSSLCTQTEHQKSDTLNEGSFSTLYILSNCFYDTWDIEASVLEGNGTPNQWLPLP